MIPLFFSRPRLVCRVSLTYFISSVWLIITLAFIQQTNAIPGLRYTLIPPGNCQAINVECAAYFTWDIPDSSGNLPPGLLGYNFYRNGSFLYFISDPYTNSYYDFPDPGTYIYSVTAWYDLTAYGFPGQFGESIACIMDTIVLPCYIIFPFIENWNQGSFQFYDWRFFPDQGNWLVQLDIGNPFPAAVFNGLPAQAVYAFTLRSPILYGQAYTCADFSFSFDYMLQDSIMSGTEHLEIGVMISDTAYPYVTLSNTGSTGWNHEELDIDQVGGHACAVYIKAYGSNSADISRWVIDNITVTVTCKPVTDLDYTLNGNSVSLFWNHPCDTLLTKNSILDGYNVYRTDQTGQPPFTKLNSDLVVVKHYIDTLPSIGQNTQYKYMVTAQFSYETINLCESPGDTLLVVPPSVISSTDKGTVTLLPNPGHGLFTLRMTETAESIEVSNIQGIIIFRAVIPKEQQTLTLDLTKYPSGFYFLRLKTSSKTVILKIDVIKNL